MFVLPTLVAILLVCGHGRASSEWTPWQDVTTAELPTALFNSAVVQFGPYVAVVGGCRDATCSTMSDDIYLYDPVEGQMHVPLAATWHSSSSSANPTGAPVPVGFADNVARLAYPVAGPSSTVQLGNSLFVVGMCTTAPGSITNLIDIVNSTSQQRIQRITLVATHTHDSGPVLAIDSEYAVLEWIASRVNASCIAHGSSVWVAGGVAYSQSNDDWEVTLEVDKVTLSLAEPPSAPPSVNFGELQLENRFLNPSMDASAEVIYILGGTRPDGSAANDLDTYFVPTGTQLLGARFPRLQSARIYTSIVGGNVVVVADNATTALTYSIMNPGSMWNISLCNSSALSFGSLFSVPLLGNLRLYSFGGFCNGTVQTTIRQSTLGFNSPPASGALVPHPSGPQPGEAYQGSSFSLSLVFSQALVDCNTSLGSNCKIRISPTHQCQNALLEFPVTDANLTRTRRNGTEWLETGRFTIPSHQALWHGTPLFLFACFSGGLVGQPAGCSPQQCMFFQRFWTPLNSYQPLRVLSVSVPTSTMSPVAPSTGWTTQKIIIIVATGTVALLILLLIVRGYCCTQAKSSDSSKKFSLPNGVLGDGRYRVLDKLGRGSFSVVYLVERVADKRKFALKYIECPDENERREAMKECEVIAKLRNHPNVIQLEDMFLSYKFDALSPNTDSQQRPADTAYPDSPLIDPNTVSQDGGRSGSGHRYLSLVMEYHDRGDLSKWVRRMKAEREKVPEATVVSIAHQVLSVLNYMHTRNPPIIHRDLKPENLLLSSVTYNNVASTFLPIVVSDFGLSRVMDKAFCETGVGSLPYVAPECWKRNYSTKIDIWAMGCILYAVCSGRVEPENVVVMFSESNRADFSSFIHSSLTKTYSYSIELAHFIGMMLETDPERRPTAEQCLDCIRRRAVGFEQPVAANTSFTVNETSISISPRRSSSATSDTIMEHYLVDVEAQEESRLAGTISRPSSSTQLTSQPRRIKRNGSRIVAKKPSAGRASPSAQSGEESPSQLSPSSTPQQPGDGPRLQPLGSPLRHLESSLKSVELGPGDETERAGQ